MLFSLCFGNLKEKIMISYYKEIHKTAIEVTNVSTFFEWNPNNKDLPKEI